MRFVVIERSLFVLKQGSAEEGRGTPESTGTTRPVVTGSDPLVRATTADATCSGSTSSLSTVALRVELAEVLLGHTVGLGARGAPPAAKIAEPLHDPVGVDPVDADADVAELGGEQPDHVACAALADE